MTSQKDFDEPEKEILDLDTAARTAMLFGLGMSRHEAHNSLGLTLPQSEAWHELWDDLLEEELGKILAGHLEIEEDKFFVKRSLFRLRRPIEPEVWVDGKWERSKFLIEALESHTASLTTISHEYALDSYPEAFADGAGIPELDSEESIASDPRLSDGVGIPIQEFMDLENQRARVQQARILDIVSGRTKAERDLYFEGFTLFRLRPSLETEVLSKGVWRNHPDLLAELHEGNLPEHFDRESAIAIFPEAF